MIVIEQESPSLPPKRIRHRAHKIDGYGRVSALCSPVPRAINMKRATWVMSDDEVTCPRCKALIRQQAAAHQQNMPAGAGGERDHA